MAGARLGRASEKSLAEHAPRSQGIARSQSRAIPTGHRVKARACSCAALLRHAPKVRQKIGRRQLHLTRAGSCRPQPSPAPAPDGAARGPIPLAQHRRDAVATFAPCHAALCMVVHAVHAVHAVRRCCSLLPSAPPRAVQGEEEERRGTSVPTSHDRLQRGQAGEGVLTGARRRVRPCSVHGLCPPRRAQKTEKTRKRRVRRHWQNEGQPGAGSSKTSAWKKVAPALAG